MIAAIALYLLGLSGLIGAAFLAIWGGPFARQIALSSLLVIGVAIIVAKLTDEVKRSNAN